MIFFFFKQKTAYEMRISDWSSDVCSSDLRPQAPRSSRRRPDAGDLAGDDRMTMRTGLDHLPAVKRRELERVARVLFDVFEDAVTTKLSDKRTGGRILKLILFGSYARGDWVEERASGR